MWIWQCCVPQSLLPFTLCLCLCDRVPLGRFLVCVEVPKASRKQKPCTSASKRGCQSKGQSQGQTGAQTKKPVGCQRKHAKPARSLQTPATVMEHGFDGKQFFLDAQKQWAETLLPDKRVAIRHQWLDRKEG